MRRIIVLAVLAAALGSAASGTAAGPEGCMAVNAQASCEYQATTQGSILASGEWIVRVYWDGTCGPESPNWVRASDPAQNLGDPSSASDGPGNNLPGGLAGAWEGSIAANSCATADVSPGGFVAIGALL